MPETSERRTGKWWGARWEAARRKGEAKGYNADKRCARAVGCAKSIRGVYRRFM